MATQGNRGLPPSGSGAGGRGSSNVYGQRTYNSFSGVDMVVTFNGKILGELQGISFTVQREKAPIYSMGEADPRSYSRAKRGIAGSMVFVVFDRSALLEAMKDTGYIANKYSIPNGYEKGPVVRPIDFAAAGAGLFGASALAAGLGAAANVTRIAIDKVVARPQYLDQVLPFDVVITAANEYGSVARMIIQGAEILNVGSSMSINDITTDEACTYVACGIIPWKDQTFITLTNDGRPVVS